MAPNSSHPAVEAARTCVIAHLVAPPVRASHLDCIPFESGYVGFAGPRQVTVCAPHKLSNPQIREALHELRQHVGPATCRERMYFTVTYAPIVTDAKVTVDIPAPGLGYGEEEFSTEGC